MTEHKYPYRGGRCFLIPKLRDEGWQIDMEIDGEYIADIYRDSQAISKEQALQGATAAANIIILSMERAASSDS